jgi:hypothetical protein
MAMHASLQPLRHAAIATAALLGLGLASPDAASALCLSGTLNTTGNTCNTFNNTGTSTATLLFSDPGINSDRYLQIGFSSASLGSTPPPVASSGFQISNIQYSLDNTTFTPFNSAGSGTVNQAISNDGTSSFTAFYTPILTLPSPLPASDTSLYIRYTLPSTITSNGKQIGVYLRTNSTGNLQASPNTKDQAGTDLLSTAAVPDNGNLLTRDHTVDLSAPPTVPGPLPLIGAAAAFGWGRRLRRRCGQGASAKLEA